MNEKAFTLAELLGVLVILSIISLIAITSVDRSIKQSRNNTCKTQEKNIIEGAKTYFVDYPNELPTTTSSSKNIYIINDLEDGGYIEDNLINPMTDEEYNSGSYVEVQLVKAGTNQYKYTLKYENEKGCTE